MPSYGRGRSRENDQRRIVGIFYITWHTQGLAGLKSPYTADVTKILEKIRTRACRPTIRCGRKVRTTTPNRKWVTSSARTNG